jgi:hypothetical protein
MIEKFFDSLYLIRAGELYGRPSDCHESEKLINDILSVLHEADIVPPDISHYSLHVLDRSGSIDDYFGKPFVFEWSIVKNGTSAPDGYAASKCECHNHKGVVFE